MPIHRIYVMDREEYNKTSGVREEKVYLVEGEIDPEKFIELFVNPRVQVFSLRPILKNTDGPVLEIRYKKTVTDPELNSLFVAAKALGETNLEWGRIGRRYQFLGIKREEALAIVEKKFFNPIVQEIADSHEQIITLKPVGAPDPVQDIDLRLLSDEQLLKLSRKNSWNSPLVQLQAIRQYCFMHARALTDAEVEIFIASWSDHCYHTTWQGIKIGELNLLEYLKRATKRINHWRVISAFHDNAGGIIFDEDTVIILKGETHNHPTAIAPFGGVATKHGGVIRDVIGFGKGGYPIGGTTIMGTSSRAKDQLPEGCLDPKRIVRESIDATAYYCNPMGIPILCAIYKEHLDYVKPLALGHCIGIIPKKYALKEDPRPGDIALLIGGKTGRDGIHGASASSGTVTAESKEKDFASVQIGDPITERKFMEAIPHLRDADCIRSLTDLGAGGIAGATGELGAKTGVRIDLDKVLLKDTSLTTWEILLSESQERMMLVIPPGKLRRAKTILKKYSVENKVIGKFTDSKKFEICWRGKKVVDLNLNFLWDECPIEKLPVEEPPASQSEARISPIRHISLIGLRDRAKELLASYNIADKSPALFQFDKTVQGRTVIEPPHISVLSPKRDHRGILTTIAFNPQWAHYDPKVYVEMNFMEAVSRAVAAGASPHDIFLCSNFYTPRPNPRSNWHLREMVKALGVLTEEFGMPVITGKDSSSGTFIAQDGSRIDVPPTFVLLALGIVPDVRRIVTQDFKQTDSTILMARPYGPLKGFFTNLHQIYRQKDNPVLAASFVGEGGLFRTLFEMCRGGEMGMTLNLYNLGDAPREEVLFGDRERTFVFEISKDADLKKVLTDLGLSPHIVLGKTHEEKQFFVYNTGTHSMRWNLDELTEAWQSWQLT